MTQLKSDTDGGYLVPEDLVAGMFVTEEVYANVWRSRNMWRGISMLQAILMLAASVLVLAGCQGSKEQIGDAALLVQRESAIASASLDAAVSTGEVGPKALPHVEKAKESVAAMGGAATSITEALPGVKNVAPWYEVWLWRIGVGAVVGVGLWAFWPFLPAILAWLIVKFPKLISLIPRTVRAMAEFDVQALDTAPPENPVRSSILTNRLKSPLYEAAFKVAKKKKEQEPKK